MGLEVEKVLELFFQKNWKKLSIIISNVQRLNLG